MRYFIDTEYDFDAEKRTIIPISIGIVAEDGRELYAITTSFIPDRCSPFVQEHVLSVLVADVGYAPIHNDIGVVAGIVKKFIGADTPEFWGDYSAFDYVVLSIIMGGFDNWPSCWPMWINDLQQDAIPIIAPDTPHHALSDARAIRDAYNWAFHQEVARI